MMRRVMKMKMRLEEAWGQSFSELRSNHAVESGPGAKDAELPVPK